MHFEFVGLKDGKPVPTAAISAGSRSALGSNVGNTTFSTDVYSRALKMGIPDHLAQLAAAQATLESGYGSSDIAKQGNNFFGIKSGSEWTGPTVDKNVDEVVDGKTVKQAAKFRKYENLDESIKDWYSVIQKNYPKSASATDLKGAIAGLSEGRLGAYSTSPDYAKKVTSVTDKVSGVVNSRYGNTEGLTPDILDKRRRLFDWDARQDIISHDLLSRTERKEQMIETVLTEAVTANNGMGNIDILAVLPKEIMGPDGKPRAFLTPEQDKKIQETRTSIISTQRSMAKAAEENRAAVEDSQIRTLKMAGLEAIANGERTPSAEWFAAAQKVSKEDMHDWFAKRAASNLDAIFTDPKYNYQQRSDFERDMRRAVARGEDVEKLTDKVLATPMHSENVKQLFEYAKSITSGPTKSILHDPLAGEMEKMLVERLRDQPIGAIMDGKVNPREPALRDKYYGFLLDEIKKANLNGAPSEIQKRAIVKAAAQHTADYFVDLGETKLKNLFDDSRKQTEPKKVELNAAQKVARGLLGIQ